MILVLSAATIAYSEPVDLKRFGPCLVRTDVDDFTDDKSSALYCVGEGSSDLEDYLIGMSCIQQGFASLLAAGIQFHRDETIDVAYRFDKGILVTESWCYNGNIAGNLDEAVHHRFVEGIEKAKRLVFKVGDEAGAVDLTGSAGAVTEYKKRCAALNRPIK